MDIQLINVGFGNTVSANKVVAIVSPASAPVKRLIAEAKECGKLIDVTQGRKTRAVVVSESGHITLSSLQPDTIASRFVVHKEGQFVGNGV